MSPDPALYRPNVGIILLNSAKEIFVAQRIDTPGPAWQMPQGGIDPNELPETAALRELAEETGCAKAKIIAQSDDWYYYDLPPHLQKKLWDGKFLGQRQKWFLMDFLGTDQDIQLETDEPEFSAWRWATPHELPDLAVDFKREIYTQLLVEFAEYF